MATATRPQQSAETAMIARNTILGTVERYADQINKVAPRGADAAYYVVSLRLYLAQNPKVLECSPGSIMQGMLRVAQTGLQLGVSCDLLPFGKSCQFSPRYNGIVELALASGVRAINADVVREGDVFDYMKGTRIFLDHRKVAKSSARITHAYAIAEVKACAFVFDVMDRDEIDQRRQQYSQSWKSQQLETIPWYAKKTVIRRLAPLLPKNPRLAAALMYADQEDDPEIPDATFEIQGEPTATTPKPIAGDEVETAPTPTQIEDWEYQDDRHLV